MTTPWIDRLAVLLPEGKLRPPATQELLDATEAGVGSLLPDDLRALLSETNGVVHREHGYDLLWPAERIAKDNLHMRSPDRDTYMPLDHLLFFADAGNGDLYGFSVTRAGVVRDDVFTLDHEDDSRRWAAPDLETFLRWSQEGKIG